MAAIAIHAYRNSFCSNRTNSPCPSAGQPSRHRPRQCSGLSRPIAAHVASIPGYAAAQQPSGRRWRHRRKAPALRAMAASSPDSSGVPAARGALPGQIGALVHGCC